MTQDKEAEVGGARTTVTLTSEIEVPIVLDEEGVRQRFALVVYNGSTTEVVRLRPNRPLVVGRDFPSHLQIDDPSVSRQHSRFVLQDGSVKLEDLGSRNGTRVNGVRIERATLAPSDDIRVGSARIALAVTRSADLPSSEPDDVVLRNQRVLEIYALARRAARTDMPVLITGETGTGKEHLARTLHVHSARSAGPWRAVNCGAIPASLVESVLFGHERGAFTGADKRTPGLFEEAERGTLFLDEVAELPPAAQTALLRVLESKTYQRVGGNQQLRADVRIVAATHCDLERAVVEGAFREDLLYRINTAALELPPLRERRDEIDALAQRFLADCVRQWGVQIEAIEPDALERLRGYEWPGNIRQLRNVIERATLVAPLRVLRVQDLPAYVRDENGPIRQRSAPAPSASRAASSEPPLVPDGGLKPALRAYEAELIEQALRCTGGNRTAAAKLLRVPIRTLFRRLSELGISEGGEASGSSS
jgi:two-component system, NtrC family, response regulator AtoC